MNLRPMTPDGVIVELLAERIDTLTGYDDPRVLRVLIDGASAAGERLSRTGSWSRCEHAGEMVSECTQRRSCEAHPFGSNTDARTSKPSPRMAG